MTDNNMDKVAELFRAAEDTARSRRIFGRRAEGEKAWYSAQRDMVNVMPSVLSAACAMAVAAMDEDMQDNCSSLVLGLNKALQGGRGGALLLPSVLARAMDGNPSSTMHLMACVGMASLIMQASLPVFSVNPDGTMADMVDPDILMDGLLCLLPPGLRDSVLEELESTRAGCVAQLHFCRALQRLAEKLAETNEGAESGDDL